MMSGLMRWLAIGAVAAGLVLAMSAVGAGPLADEAPDHGLEPGEACPDAPLPLAPVGPLACDEHPAQGMGSLGDGAPSSEHDPSLGAGCAVPNVDDKCEAWTEDGYNFMAAGPNGHSVYGLGPGGLAGLDVETGEAHWVTSEGFLRGWDIELSSDGSTVYVADIRCQCDGFSEVFAYDAYTGEMRWASGTVEVMADASANPSLAVDPEGGSVFLLSTSPENPRNGHNLQVHAFDAASGDELWKSGYDGPAEEHDYAIGIDVSPDGSNVFISGNSLAGAFALFDSPWIITVASFDAETGDVAWGAHHSDPSGPTTVSDAPAVSADGERVYIAGNQETDFPHNDDTTRDFVTVAFDAQDGDELWAVDYRGPPEANQESDDRVHALVASPSEDDRVYVTGQSGWTDWNWATVAYDGETGALEWVTEFSTPGHIVERPSDIAIAPDGGHVYVFGESTPYYFAPSAFGTVAYDTASGEQAWAARMGHNPTGQASTVQTTTVGPIQVEVSGTGEHVFTTGIAVQQGLVSADHITATYETGAPELLPQEAASTEVSEG